MKKSLSETRQIKQYFYRDYVISIRENGRRDKFLEIIRDRRDVPCHIVPCMEHHFFTFKGALEKATRLVDEYYELNR